jgi:hypothetical protein
VTALLNGNAFDDRSLKHNQATLKMCTPATRAVSIALWPAVAPSPAQPPPPVVVVGNEVTFGNGTTIGNIRDKGTHLIRVEKKGDVVTFSVCINYDGKFNADITHAVTNLKEFVPNLTEKNTHVFFGGGGTFKQVRFSVSK